MLGRGGLQSLRRPNLVDLASTVDMPTSMCDRRIQIVEQMTSGVEVGQDACCSKNPSVLGPCTLDEDRDVSPVEFADDSGKGIGSGGIDERQPLQAQNDDTDVFHLTELLKKAGSRPEEEGAVQPEHCDVVREEGGVVNGSVVMLC